MRSAGLYSTARYGLYFEQYIDGYMMNIYMSYLGPKIDGVYIGIIQY